MDAIDKRILRIIQQDASRAVSEIATQVGLSQTPCWKRLQRLAASGVIKRRVALLDCRMAGDVDYFLRVVVADTAAFDVFYQRLIELIPLKNVTSRFALENIKTETALPIKD